MRKRADMDNWWMESGVPVWSCRRATLLLREFRLSAAIALAFNRNDLGVVRDPVDQVTGPGFLVHYEGESAAVVIAR
jgi:hypothetical protein